MYKYYMGLMEVLIFISFIDICIYVVVVDLEYLILMNLKIIFVV